MDRLWRSNSFISSRTGCPPDIVNEEDHNVDDSEIPDFSKWTIPRVDTKNVYKIGWAESTFHFAYKLELLNKYFLFPKLMKNAACFLKRILVNILLLKNSTICILEWFKLLLNHSPERELMLLFSCVYVMLDLRTLKIAFLV